MVLCGPQCSYGPQLTEATAIFLQLYLLRILTFQLTGDVHSYFITYNLFIFNLQVCYRSGRSQFPAIMNLACNHEKIDESQQNTGNIDVKKKTPKNHEPKTTQKIYSQI